MNNIIYNVLKIILLCLTDNGEQVNKKSNLSLLSYFIKNYSIQRD